MGNKNAPDEVLLTEITNVLSPGMLRKGDAIAGEGELVEAEDYLFINNEYKSILANQFLAKAREAVEGARLTPQQVQDSYHSTPELLEKAKEYYGDTIEYFDATQLACRWSVAEAQTKAILKALGGE